jgi:hypothetical protein
VSGEAQKRAVGDDGDCLPELLQQVLAQPHWTGRLTSTDLRALTPLI